VSAALIDRMPWRPINDDLVMSSVFFALKRKLGTWTPPLDSVATTTSNDDISLEKVAKGVNTTKPSTAWMPEGRGALTPMGAMIRRAHLNPIAGYRRRRYRLPTSIWRGEEGSVAGGMEEWGRGNGTGFWGRRRLRGNASGREGGDCLFYIHARASRGFSFVS